MWSSLVEVDEGSLSPSGKLLCLWQTSKIMQKMTGIIPHLFHCCWESPTTKDLHVKFGIFLWLCMNDCFPQNTTAYHLDRFSWAFPATKELHGKDHLEYRKQCDQIGRFIGLWASIQSIWPQLICPNLLHSFAIFVKVSKSFIFLVKFFLANFHINLAIFFWSHWS